MKILENIPLASYTTFKIGGPARYFCVVKTPNEAKEAFEFAKKNDLDIFILGGGSNVLISDKGFGGLVIKIESKGIEIVREDNASVTLKIASGEIWDEVVKFAVENQWWGIENLSHIPGNTGAIAVQNVGAYGQEAGNVIEAVTVLDTQTREILELDNNQCEFSYRKSIFNSSQKGKYVIFNVTIKLSKTPRPILSYRDLRARFAGRNPDIEEIRQAVIEIRDKKYPFPKEAKNGNAGSFFKNPVLSKESYQQLMVKIQNSFGNDKAAGLEKKVFESGGNLKVPAAFLVEICGLKDIQAGGAKINHNQPLIIINESGKAVAADVLELVNKVIKSVHQKTGLILSIEPELIGFSKPELDAIIN